MRRQCQFTVKRSEKRVVLTVAPEQQLCVVQVVERVGLVASSFQFYIRFGACKKTRTDCREWLEE